MNTDYGERLKAEMRQTRLRFIVAGGNLTTALAGREP
jgi:hypothetical protein